MTTTLASSVKRSQVQAFRELIAARELIVNLVRRDLKARYRGTFLGLLWSLVTPLLMVALYTFIFTVMFRLVPSPGRDYPFALFFFCGLVLWNLFAGSVGNASNSVIGSGYLLGKLYFPREVLPLTSILSGLVTFLFEASVLLAIAWILQIWPTPWIVMMVPIVGIVLLLAYGLGMLLSALTVFFRDIGHFIGIALQLWFWGTPIIYALDFVADRPRLQTALMINPMTGPVTGFRNVLLDGHAPDFMLLAYSFGVAVVIFLVGALVFARTQKLFPEMV